MSWAIAPDVRFRRVLDEGLVIRQRAYEVLGLNLAGLRILELLREGVSIQELTARLAEESGVPAAEVAADVAGFVEELAAAGVLVHRPGASGEAGGDP